MKQNKIEQNKTEQNRLGHGAIEDIIFKDCFISIQYNEECCHVLRVSKSRIQNNNDDLGGGCDCDCAEKANAKEE